MSLTLHAGVEFAADGSPLLATVQASSNSPSRLLSVSSDTAESTLIGAVGAQVGEGTLALDPLTLLRIDLPNGTATVVGEIGLGDISALAFDASGTLYAIDTGAVVDSLLVLDPADASTLSSVALSEPLGALAGMDFDPATGTLYVADGGAGGADALFTLDPATGVLSEVGPLGLANGLSGLAVPEPGAAGLAVVAVATLWSVAARRR